MHSLSLVLLLGPPPDLCLLPPACTLTPSHCLPHQVDPRIGPYSFTVDAVQQDRQGFVYLLVTQPFDQSTLVSRICQLYG